MRFRSVVLALSFTCATVIAATPAKPASDDFSPAQKEAIEAILKDYIAKHPEIVVDALQAAEDKAKNEERDKGTAALATKKKEVFDDPESPVSGNPKGDVTMVEFFDYRCPYCKMVEPLLEKLLGEDKGVRFVYKEFPILGADSELASRAALASVKQGKYEAMHRALMALKGQLDEESVMTTAASIQLDVKRLKQDMESPEVEKALQTNYDLASALSIHGTPAFVIGDQIVASAMRISTMKQMIEDVRHK